MNQKILHNWLNKQLSQPFLFGLFYVLLFSFIHIKYGSSNDPGNPFIKINLSATKKKIIFFVENSKPNLNNKIAKKTSGGIGLKIIKKRFEIIYGDNYNLKISNNEQTFVVL